MARFNKSAKYVMLLISYVGLVVLIAEYLVYYIVMFQCVWPSTNQEISHHNFGQIGEAEWIFRQREPDSVLPRRSGEAVPQRTVGTKKAAAQDHVVAEPEAQLRTFFIADTHLLGSRLGHWFDKLRREWQMERAFQAAVTLLSPEAVFVLGDLTDEGKWASDQEFEATAKRFREMFRHPPNVHFKVVVGNHDVGFHNLMSKHKLARFSDAFSSTGIEVFTLKNISFVLVNSMAFHGDGCKICSSADKELRKASERFNCSRFGDKGGRGHRSGSGVKSNCEQYQGSSSTPPILLQHFPLYRPSDEVCSGVDGTPLSEKYIPHGERREVISKEATEKLLWWIQPRLVLSGHTHHGCYVVHRNSTPEISVPSFSWRNRKNPSIVMASITPSTIAINKCFLPEESSVIYIYIASGIALATWLLWSLARIIFGQQRREHSKDL